MVHRAILYAVLVTGFMHGCDLPHIIAKTKECGKKAVPTGISCGSLCYVAGTIASFYPDPAEQPYSGADVTQFIGQKMEESAYPAIKECAEYAPTVGLTCCIAPAACWCLSSCALAIIKRSRAAKCTPTMKDD